MNQEKLHGLQGQVCKIIVNSKEIPSNSEIRKELRNYYKVHLFQVMNSFLTKLIFQSLILVTKTSVTRIYLNLNFYLLGMENNKSPGNDSLTKEFYVSFLGLNQKAFQ